jgi:hypothetical protein
MDRLVNILGYKGSNWSEIFYGFLEGSVDCNGMSHFGFVIARVSLGILSGFALDSILFPSLFFSLFWYTKTYVCTLAITIQALFSHPL